MKYCPCKNFNVYVIVMSIYPQAQVSPNPVSVDEDASDITDDTIVPEVGILLCRSIKVVR